MDDVFLVKVSPDDARMIREMVSEVTLPLIVEVCEIKNRGMEIDDSDKELFPHLDAIYKAMITAYAIGQFNALQDSSNTNKESE